MTLIDYETELFKRIQEFVLEWDTETAAEAIDAHDKGEDAAEASDMNTNEWDDQFASWGEMNGTNPTGERNHENRRGE